MGNRYEHCCGAGKLFDLKRATKELRAFRKNGTKGATQKLIEAIQSVDGNSRSLLDIGGGIGAIQWSFLENFDTITTDVDASEGYLQVAMEYAQSKDWGERSNFIKADFLDCANQLEIHDCVTMDKVVCCYPDYEELLSMALAKCRHTFALTFPMAGPVSRLLAEIANLYLNLWRNPFRPYIHAPEAMRDIINDYGFTSKYQSIKFPWHIEIYTKE